MLINIFSYKEDAVRDAILSDARSFSEQHPDLGDPEFVCELYRYLLKKYPQPCIDVTSASFEVFVADAMERQLILALRERFGHENVIVVRANLKRQGGADRYSYVLYVIDPLFCQLSEPLPSARRFRVVTDVVERVFVVREAFAEAPLQRLLRFKTKAKTDYIDEMIDAALPAALEADGNFLLPVAADCDYKKEKNDSFCREEPLTDSGLFFTKAQLRSGIVVDLRSLGRVRVNFNFDALRNEQGTFDPALADNQYLVSLTRTEDELTTPVEAGQGAVVIGGKAYYCTASDEHSAPFFGVFPVRLMTIRMGFGQAHVHISFKGGKPRIAWVRRTA